jgi:putative ABC transport system permease protein
VAEDLPLETAALYGLDDASLVGMPSTVVAGSLDALKAPGTVMMDANGWRFLYGDQPFLPGKVLELNDNRAEIVGLVAAGTLFDARVAIYARYRTALNYAPGGRHRMSFVVARSQEGEDPAVVAQRIREVTGYKALTDREFALASSLYLIGNSGIPIVFGAVVSLGVVVGIVIVALTFSLFIRDNLRQFGALKAIGVTNARLMGMVLLQGGLVGLIGYALGIGAATLIVTQGARNTLELAGFYVPWQVAAFAAASVTLIVTIAGVGGMRKVFRTDPAEVFRG